MNRQSSQGITLNSDIGESFGTWKMGADDLIMPHIDCANVACGFHASDPLTMLKTVNGLDLAVIVGFYPVCTNNIGIT